MHNSTLNAVIVPSKPGDKQGKAFSVYSDRPRYSNSAIRPTGMDVTRQTSPRKRPSDLSSSSASQPTKRRSPKRLLSRRLPTISKETIEDIIEKKVDNILAARALDQASIAPQPEISEEVQRRLDLLEQRIDGKDDGREQGLAFLLMAKQHAVRGEHTSALRMYTLAKPYFPDNRKLDMKMERLREKIEEKRENARDAELDTLPLRNEVSEFLKPYSRPRIHLPEGFDQDYQEEEVACEEYDSDSGFRYKAKAKKANPKSIQKALALSEGEGEGSGTPRTKRLLDIVNGRDKTQIRLLKGVGAKKAEAIIKALCASEEGRQGATVIHNLEELGRLKGVSAKTVEAMRSGL